jgi:hypothetical protein
MEILSCLFGFLGNIKRFFPGPIVAEAKNLKALQDPEVIGLLSFLTSLKKINSSNDAAECIDRLAKKGIEVIIEKGV